MSLHASVLEAHKVRLVLQYAKQLRQLRESAQEEIDLAKRRDGLEGINVDVTQIKPKFTE